jgi:hypothetical protein
MKKITLKPAAALLAILLIASPIITHAASPISDVGSAAVYKGETATDARFGYNKDGENDSSDDRFRMRQHLDYGFTDYYAFRVILAQDKRQGDDLEHQRFGIENRFQVIEKRDYGWDGGFRVRYSQNDGDKSPNEFDIRLLAQVPFGNNWEWRKNALFIHEVGEEAEGGMAIELRNQITRSIPVTHPLIKDARLGLEMFNDLGKSISEYDNQDHQIGPVLKMKFPSGIEAQTGYRAGISPASVDNTFKFFVGKKF